MLSQTELMKYDIVYPYGSRVYGTFNNNSDYDYICIGNQPEEWQNGLINVHVYTFEHFQQMINEHHISALECLFLSEKLIIKQSNNKFDFKLNLQDLRHSISKKASHSFVKAKKKFESPYIFTENSLIEERDRAIIEERERGKKSLFHSMRILQFGIQIAAHGKIIDYGSANDIYNEIFKEDSVDWNDYFERWKKEYNKLSTDFRLVAKK